MHVHVCMHTRMHVGRRHRCILTLVDCRDCAIQLLCFFVTCMCMYSTWMQRHIQAQIGSNIYIYTHVYVYTVCAACICMYIQVHILIYMYCRLFMPGSDGTKSPRQRKPLQWSATRATTAAAISSFPSCSTSTSSTCTLVLPLALPQLLLISLQSY